MLTQRCTAAAAGVLLVLGLAAPVAHAEDPGGGVCKGGDMWVSVCAKDGSISGGSSGSSGSSTTRAGTGSGSSGGGSAPSCTYEKLDPQPPAENLAWEGKTAKDGAVYRVNCPDSGRVGVVFIPSGGGAPAPRIDPEVVARRAVDSMRLDGPAVASPRSAGTYVIGMPVWMWVTPSPNTFGPVTASATAGGVTVTATATVSSVRWDMGDGKAVTCAGPGTRYTPDRGKTMSPDCGHRYEHTSAGKPGERYKGRATATWTVEWSAPALGDAGTLTETRETTFTVRVVEVQVLN
ncbi:ATP/GTP-binding protein [Streptomyces sp. NPDC012508]|uniref:ATP/GTP-binding protein n=1 Tax=Streptomyces sp. NPDC012508 TaxID=3364837 RepID=UPI0036B68F5A